METESRIPHGMRGLKFRPDTSNVAGHSRIPHGMRGLKSVTEFEQESTLQSHPAWDAWIEIMQM